VGYILYIIQAISYQILNQLLVLNSRFFSGTISLCRQKRAWSAALAETSLNYSFKIGKKRHKKVFRPTAQEGPTDKAFTTTRTKVGVWYLRAVGRVGGRRMKGCRRAHDQKIDSKAEKRGELLLCE
jgi:hypothetical protein